MLLSLRRGWIACCLLLAGLAVPAAAAPLAELVRLAETYDNDFLVEKALAAQSREAAPLAQAELLPQVSADARGQQNKDNEQEWSAGIAVSQPLFNLPRYHLLQAANEQVTIADIEFSAARDTLRRDVILAWLDVQLAAETLRLVQKRHATLKAQLERTEALAAAGQVVESDVLSARAGLASTRSQLAQAKHDLSAAHDTINRYSGAHAADKRLALDKPLPPLPPLPTWLQQLEQDNLQLKAARQQVAFMRRRLQAAESAVLPRLSLSGGFTLREGNEVTDNWQLLLQQQLFTGGSFSAERRQLLAESDIAHKRVAALRARQTQTVRRLHGQMQADLARLQALGDAAASAEALLRAVTVGYDNGVNIIADVLDAEADLFDAELSQHQAAYGYLQNLVTARALFADLQPDFVEQIEQFFIPAGKETT